MVDDWCCMLDARCLVVDVRWLTPDWLMFGDWWLVIGDCYLMLDVWCLMVEVDRWWLRLIDDGWGWCLMVDLVQRFWFMEGKPIRTDWLHPGEDEHFWGEDCFLRCLTKITPRWLYAFLTCFLLHWFAPLPLGIVAFYGKMWMLHRISIPGVVYRTCTNHRTALSNDTSFLLFLCIVVLLPHLLEHMKILS